MTRVFAFALALASVHFAGCATDPCAGSAGTCVGLIIEGDNALLGMVNQLVIGVQGPNKFAAMKPGPPEPLASFPIATSIQLPAAVAGNYTFTVTALRDSKPIGSAAASTDLAVGDHQTLTLTLATHTGGGGLDASVPIDQAPSQDLAVPDLSSTNRPRRVFLLPAHNGSLGMPSDLDTQCNTAGQATGSTFRVLLGTSTSNPTSAFVPNHRQIVLPDLVTRIATDETFFTDAHDNPINQLISTQTVTGGSCVWTGFSPSGAAMSPDCLEWSTSMTLIKGVTGSADAKDNGRWAADKVARTCDTPCFVYCIEQ